MSTTSHQADIDEQLATERWVMEVCASIQLPLGDQWSDFFAAGGTSMMAMRLVASAEERFGEDALPPEDLLQCRSVIEIAAVIRRNRIALTEESLD